MAQHTRGHASTTWQASLHDTFLWALFHAISIQVAPAARWEAYIQAVTGHHGSKATDTAITQQKRKRGTKE